MLINSPFPYHYRAWNSPCIFIHYVRFFITFSNFSPTKLQYIKPVDFDIWHTIKILTHYNCTAVFSQTLHRPCRWHLGTPNACALDVIESLHEVSSATDDVDNVLWFPREVWFRCSCTFARSSLVFQSVFHSLDANVVSLAQIWYDFFCEVLWRNLLKTYFLEHTFCFAFSAWFSLKRKILCYACFDSRSICFLVFTFFNLFHSQEVTYVTWYHYLVLTPRSSRRGKPTRELWIAIRPGQLSNFSRSGLPAVFRKMWLRRYYVCWLCHLTEKALIDQTFLFLHVYLHIYAGACFSKDPVT